MGRFFIAFLTLFWLIPSALGQGADEPGEVGLEVAEHDELGTHLTDTEGRSLYLFLSDLREEPYRGPHPSTCYEQCAENWPPLITEAWPLPEEHPGFGEGVDEELVASVEREDGSVQLTYGDWPLYYFARDEVPGDVNGQGVGDVWYLISPEGEAIRPEATNDQEDSAEGNGSSANGGMESADSELMSLGSQVFSNNCVVCHGAQAQGDSGPNLASGNRVVANADRFIRTVLNGGHQMPAFGGQLSDREVAAVVTFVRNSWENDHGSVTEEEVSEWR